jgi:sugar O-acyltransferase (sialic acid O-acetyltransferase NeuD family)
MTNDIHSPGIEGYPIIYEQKISIETILKNYKEIIVAIGNNDLRLKISLKYESHGMKLAKIIHPKASISENAEIGGGTTVFANAVINPFVKIGKACIINTGAIIDHNCTLSDGVHISPNAALGGTVKIGKKTWICIGSSIANDITIGQDCVIGAGSAVISDIPDNVLAAGVPAKIKRQYRK